MLFRSRQPGIRELCGSVIMIHKVRPAVSRVSDLPAGREWTQVVCVGGGGVAGPARDAGVVPRGYARLCVEVVHLALLRGALLCKVRAEVDSRSSALNLKE